MCGDSTNSGDVALLMDGKKADIVFTDPPYGAKITGFMQDCLGVNRSRHWDMIEGDQFENEELQLFLEKAFLNISQNSKDNAAWYIWHAMLTQGFFAAAAAAANLILNRQIIWVKPCLILAFGDYHWRHELAFYGWKKGFKPDFFGDKGSTTVWEIDFDGKKRGNSKDRVHPTQKPVSLAEKAIINSSRRNETIIDLFLGSGSTLIACEKTNRICYGMEISEHYCSVIIKRWQEFTGKKAERVMHEKTRDTKVKTVRKGRGKNGKARNKK
jgi:site-specific DNA-methyltransferase (adenine-specific)